MNECRGQRQIAVLSVVDSGVDIKLNTTANSSFVIRL